MADPQAMNTFIRIARLMQDDPQQLQFIDKLAGRFDADRMQAVLDLLAPVAQDKLSEAQLRVWASLMRRFADQGDDWLEFWATLMRRASYAEDLLASRAAASWLDDPAFQAAYDAGASISTWGTDIRWRSYTLMRAARMAARKPGDFVECGVHRGGTAMNVIAHLGVEAFADRRFFLYDTYEGLKEEQMIAAELENVHKPEGYYPPVLDAVRENFAPYDFARIVPGMVPDTLDAYDGEQVAYLHIDMNVSLPELAALEYFWPKLVPGGVVVFDDYGFPQHIEQQKALDDLVRGFGAEIIMLPTGQGLLWK